MALDTLLCFLGASVSSSIKRGMICLSALFGIPDVTQVNTHEAAALEGLVQRVARCPHAAPAQRTGQSVRRGGVGLGWQWYDARHMGISAPPPSRKTLVHALWAASTGTTGPAPWTPRFSLLPSAHAGDTWSKVCLEKAFPAVSVSLTIRSVGACKCPQMTPYCV